MRKQGFLAAAAAALLAVAGCADDNRPCQLAVATALPFRVAHGHIYVDVVINGKTANFMFDTGNESTTLTTDGINRLGLSTQALFGSLEGVGGGRGLSRTMTREVQFGRLKGTDFPLLVADIHMETTTPPADGIIGMDFLARYDFDLDWAARQVTLYRKVQGCGQPSAALAQPLSAVPLLPVAFDHPAIRFPVTISGQQFTAELDTGAFHTTLFRRAARRLGLTKTVLAADPHGHIGGIGPREVEATGHVFDAVTIGDLTLKSTKVIIADQDLDDVDMLVGMPFATRVHVWVSNSSHTLILQYPPSATPTH